MSESSRYQTKIAPWAIVIALGLLTAQCASKSESQNPGAVNKLDASAKQNEIAFDTQFNQLQAQMTFEQVKNLLGAPDLRELKSKTETWHFKRRSPSDQANAQSISRRVVFENGKLTEFGSDEPAPPVVQVVASPTPGVNLEIGQPCKLDKECKQHNCHFHACSGPNNCTVSLGQVCAVDTDCCSNFCDFGFCKTR